MLRKSCLEAEERADICVRDPFPRMCSLGGKGACKGSSWVQPSLALLCRNKKLWGWSLVSG